MKKFIFLVSLIIVNFGFAQVGINTTEPKATLDVRKANSPNLADGILVPRTTGDSLVLKDDLYDETLDGAYILVSEAVTPANATKKTQNITSPGFYTYNASFTHSDGTKGIWQKFYMGNSASGTNVYAFKASQGIPTLLGISLSFGSTFSTLRLSSMTAQIGQNFINNNNQYVVPETGIYQIHYSYKLGTGVSATLLNFSSNTGPTIIKTSGTTSTIIDNRQFGGINLGLAGLSLSQTSSTNLYQLQSGDLLNFGVITSGLNLDVLGEKSVDIVIYKVN